MPNPVNKLSESEDVFTKRLTVALSLGYEYLGRLKYSLHIPENRWCDYGIYRKISTGGLALKIEKSIHTKFKKSRFNGKEMKTYFNSSGFNDCYPIEMLGTLLEELKSYKIKEENDN